VSAGPSQNNLRLLASLMTRRHYTAQLIAGERHSTYVSPTVNATGSGPDGDAYMIRRSPESDRDGRRAPGRRSPAGGTRADVLVWGAKLARATDDIPAQQLRLLNLKELLGSAFFPSRLKCWRAYVVSR
jgi:hypothetical protein